MGQGHGRREVVVGVDDRGPGDAVELVVVDEPGRAPGPPGTRRPRGRARTTCRRAGRCAVAGRRRPPPCCSSGAGMNCASCHSVRCLSVNQTVMKSFSSPLKRRYHWNDAVRSVTSWRSAATRGPSGRQLARGPGVDAGDGRRHLLVGGEIDDRHGASRAAAGSRSAALDEAARRPARRAARPTCGPRPARYSGEPAAPRRWRAARPPAARRRPWRTAAA